MNVCGLVCVLVVSGTIAVSTSSLTANNESKAKEALLPPDFTNGPVNEGFND